MKIKAIITGATGMVGKGVLLECLKSDEVDQVLVVNRNRLNLEHSKLKEVIVKDFFDLSSIENELKGYNVCYFCLGVTSAGKSEEDYKRLTYDLTLNFAQKLSELNKDMVFCYVSGTGTDSSEKGRVMWARVKGKTENDLMKLPFKNTYMFRPGFIEPQDGIKSKTKLYNFFYIILWPFFPIFRLMPKYATTTRKLGRAMINVILSNYQDAIIETKDINKLS